MYRQGDVLLLPTRVPASAQELPVERGPLVLAGGERTGHSHSIDAACARLLAYRERRFIRVEQPTCLTHQEHSPIPIPPGEYEVIRQVEYSPFLVRRVAD